MTKFEIILICLFFAVGIITKHYEVYNPLVGTTILYALLQIIKIMNTNAWTFDDLADNKKLILYIWTVYIIGASWYLLGQFYHVPKIGLGI